MTAKRPPLLQTHYSKGKETLVLCRACEIRLEAVGLQAIDWAGEPFCFVRSWDPLDGPCSVCEGVEPLRVIKRPLA